MPVRMSSPLLGGLFGCLLGSVVSECHTLLFTAGPCFLTSLSSVVMLIMMFIAYRKHRNFNSALLTVFYRDGIFYFICLSGELTLSAQTVDRVGVHHIECMQHWQ